MTEHRSLRARLRSDGGTTLSELLIVMLILGIIGTVTTTGIVRSFRTQLAATDVAETLDATRLATQRVRDYVRQADEVCANSGPDSLWLWADDDDDGVVDDGEIDIFELATDATLGDVFRRRVPTSTGDEVQLIRDDIINATLFTYDVEPIDQPASTTCLQGQIVTPGGSAETRIVDVAFTVANPNPANPDLSTSTSVRLRNAGLSGAPGNQRPEAQFDFVCPLDDRTCYFDASPSIDVDGLIVGWAWDFGDGTTGTGETPTHTFTLGGDVPYDVTLTVTDDDSGTDGIEQVVTPVEPGTNVDPVANFTVTCNGLICDFDGTGSTDNSAIVSYEWAFGDGATGSGATARHTYTSSGSYPVTLTVTDDHVPAGTGTESRPVNVSDATMRVASLGATTVTNSGSWDATFTIDLSLTTSGGPGDGVVITGQLTGSRVAPVSCNTTNSRCTIAVTGIPNGNPNQVTLTVTNVQDTGPYTYESSQNAVTSVTVTKQGTVSTN